MSTWRIARRNLGRNLRRTLIALGAIVLAQSAVLLIDGLLGGYSDAMIDAVTGPMIGHVQIHAPKWRQERDMERTIDHVGKALHTLREVEGVKQASARLYAPALVALGQQGFVGMVLGLDPVQESGANGVLSEHPSLAKKLKGREALVGSGLAREMGVKPGDELAIVGQGADGSIANDLVRVMGVIRSPIEIVQSSGLILPLDAAQELFVMPDQAHEITVHGQDAASADALAKRIAAVPMFAGMDVKSWRELAPELIALLEINQAFTWIILLLVFVAAAAGVANTMLMATFERNHELGMLLALGCTPRRIVSMITLEALFLGLCGVALGTAVGVAVNMLLAQQGIDLASLGGKQALENLTFGGMNNGLRIVPRTSATAVLGGIGAVTLTALLSSLWPAFHAARLQPVEAMRE